jgi:sulfofructose kinase
MTAMGARVVALGTANYDHRLWVRRFPPDAPRTRASDYLEDLGGPAAVAARTVARLGGQAAFVGRRGDDQAGRRLEAWLASDGVDTRWFAPTPGARTPVSVVLISPDGERYIFHYAGAGLPETGDWDADDLLRGAGAVLVDLRWPAAASRLAREARARGIAVVVDMDRDIPEAWALAALSTHTVADGFMAEATGGIDALLARLRDVGAWGAVTVGRDGVCYRGGRVPAFPVAVRDSTGAGDVFHGAFALALAEGRGEADALVFASAAAALRCASGAVPYRRDVEHLLEARDAARGADHHPR